MWRNMSWTVTALLTTPGAKITSRDRASPAFIPFFDNLQAQAKFPFEAKLVEKTLSKYDEAEQSMVADPCYFQTSLSRDEKRLPLKPTRDAPEGDEKVELHPISISASNVSSNVGLVHVLRELKQYYTAEEGSPQYTGFKVFVADVAIYKRILKVCNPRLVADCCKIVAAVRLLDSWVKSLFEIFGVEFSLVSVSYWPGLTFCLI